VNTIESIRVVIVDDHPMWREGVISSIQTDGDISVVGEGSNADEALELSIRELPDVAFLDLNMPGGGLKAASMIAQACPVTKIVMLTFSEEEDDVLAALKAGARGYVLKGVLGKELRGIVRSIYAGEVYVSPVLAAAMLREMATASTVHAGDQLDQLTPRETQIVELVAEGFSNKEIGARLGLTEKTVKHYMTNVLQKLQVRNRVEAAIKWGKITP
jgi:two-component system, NarL family, nitrate/nitrite response regulator NarL